ncbi:MAG: DUF5674 family protein [Defluviitaleaceae bacterium]|nr:DUF5674 family protein [Defluviitaleaceae bacterium]
MILHSQIGLNDFRNCVHKNFGEFMVKFVADLRREILAYDGEWHADLEAELLADNSSQKNLWGFNYYPEKDMLEYNSLINIRPLENKSTDILDPSICENIARIFRVWVRGE